MKKSDRKEFEIRKKNICFELALKLKGGYYNNALQINKVNAKYRELLDSCASEKDVLLIEKQLFEGI